MGHESRSPKGNRNLDAEIRQVNDERCMAYPVRSRQSSRIVTTNVEESAEVEVAVLAQNKAKDRIIRSVNQECMFRCFADEWQRSKRQCDRPHRAKHAIIGSGN